MRYFFHTADGSRDRDTEGTELDSPRAAKAEAIKFAGHCIADQPDVLFDARDFRVEVTDTNATLLFTIVTLAIDAPAIDDI
ncbi:hypothetical protein EAH79_01335 [Sphingomonas koreensis]|nr:hypothetical protein EAH79_01335 [Sphingomonas koreensis]